MKKGIIFTIDALVAVAIAVLALILITQIISMGRGEWYGQISLYYSMQDFMAARDKDGTFKNIFTQTDVVANNTLRSLISEGIPQNMVVRINITICRYSSGFDCYRNLTVGENVSTDTRSVVRRVFTNTVNNSYGIAVMEGWYR